ncbi:class I SAM-dependent rRNA methyltransferase [Thermovenabulum gondwanense]|uniref:Ribosomal RNA large subunit methyltransferase I n=1 Tax=Thermovenabulum gondwanense TaxID=520767 RepID=A0A161PWD0_9FIRM|nr:class I SAM-dependent rRNA methyltransferase [Thermovenabulum gondwanense]KYO67820.1 Ribosomal RNA large subunit methyltransferase I [Thermovenabulum gondwanense]
MAKVILKGKKNERIEKGHPWVYSTEILNIKGNYKPGDIVEVYLENGKFLGKGYINPKSQITVRFLTKNKDEDIDREFFKNRIIKALNYRKQLNYGESYRLIYAEADFLPALIVDKFNNTLVIQTLSLGMEKYKNIIVDILVELLSPKCIYERNDAPVRELEGLELKKGVLYGELPEKIIIEENDIQYYVDVVEGQKTGFFFDQRENRKAIEPFVKGREILECFCYTGSFALNAAKYGANNILAYDYSDDAISLARENAKLNGMQDIIKFEVGNAFDILRKFYNDKKKFDVVILDPPAFVKNKKALEGALRGYKEINLRGMKLLKPGGFLITSSCSHHVNDELFFNILMSAAYDAKVTVRIIEKRSQAKDHPVLAASEETSYLKFYILEIY